MEIYIISVKDSCGAFLYPFLFPLGVYIKCIYISGETIQKAELAEGGGACKGEEWGLGVNNQDK